MPIANALSINTAATAADMANTMFGSGIQIVSASYSGDAVSSGVFSGATSSIAGISPSDTGVILSTGNVGSFTNSSGTTNTNTAANTGVDTANGINGDSGLNSVAGVTTFDGAIFNASFIPTGDYLTMQFVFSSEEYLEYVNGGVNDAVGVWVNGNFVPLTVGSGEVSIDTLNNGVNSNLYVDNPAATDLYNTEMDGFTVTLSLKAPVIAGQTNTIKIGIADGGDAVYDSNLLIMGDSIQTVALANDDTITATANSSRTFDILANDTDLTDSGLTITHINGNAIAVNQIVTLGTGEQVRLNADGTITVFTDGDIGENSFTYTIVDGQGNSDIGFITVKTVGALAPDGIVEGTSGADTINGGYLGDPDGDRVDNNDALGVGGTTGDGDYIIAGAGADSVQSGVGNDIVYAGTGNDTVYAGSGNDSVYGQAGDDSLFGEDGNDSLYGGAGADVAYGGAGDDSLSGGAGNDTLDGGLGNDTIRGGDGADQITTGEGANLAYGGAGNDNLVGDLGSDTLHGDDGFDSLYGGDGNDSLYGGGAADSLEGGLGADFMSGGDDSDTFVAGAGDTVDGGEGGTDEDTLRAAGVKTILFDPLNSENGTITFIDNSTMTFSNIEHLLLNGGNPDGIISGTGSADMIGAGYVDANGDIIDAGDALFAGAGPDDDDIFADGGNDTVNAGEGADNVYGGDGDDSLNGDAGNDYMQGDTGNDTLYGGAGDDFMRGDAGNDSVYGGDGNDSVYGGSGNDQIFGGNGNDVMFGGYDNDTVYGGAGNDTITGSGESDLIYGEDGDDSIQGSNGSDTIYGGLGADTMLGEEDGDTFYAGAGDYVDGFETFTTGSDNDTLYVVDVASVSYDPGNPENGTVFFNAGGSMTFYNIEHLYVDGVLQGTRDGIVTGTSGDDLIQSGSAVDPDGDVVDGADAILPGAAPEDDRVHALGGNDTVNAGLGNDLVYGGDGNDSVSGDVGNDSLYGDAGNDLVSGGTGADQLFGGAGTDTLSGGDGNDTLNGDAGADTLQGNGGDDSFQLSNSFGNDVITGGETAETNGDTLDLSGVTSNLAVNLGAANPETGTVS